MKSLTRKAWFILLASLALLFILFTQFVPGPVRADVGVQPILPGGSNIKGEDETPIQMAAETVEMTVRKATEADNDLIQLNPESYGLRFTDVWFTAIAEVNADFSMHNPTGEMISMTVWFPLASALESVGWEINPDETVPRIKSFEVSADGNPIDYAVSELPSPKGGDKPLLPWASFPITFAAEKETTIQVSYLVPLAPSIKGSPLALYYVFQTGSDWAGPIGQAELIVNLPYPASEETIAELPSDSLVDLPYIMAGASTGLPSGAITEANQARWEWKDFEPGPQDDFSIWLIDPTNWEELTDARTALQADPENGARWLKLAGIYHSLATVGYNSASAFSNTYQPLGIEAYQMAASLIPDNPRPHAGLGLLMLSTYVPDTNASHELMDAILVELAICKELASKSPYAEAAEDYCWQLEAMLSFYSFDTTATVESIASSTVSAQRTLDASIVLIPTSTPKLENTPTMIPVPTNTAFRQPTMTPTPVQAADSRQNLPLFVAVGILALILAGYLIWKHLRGGIT